MKLYSSLLDMHDVEAYIRAIARNAGLTVHWGPKDGGAATDGKIIQLPRITSKDTPEEVITTVGLAIHEAQGHVLHSSFDLLNKIGVTCHNSPLGVLWNSMEDHRIEWLAAKMYDGDRTYLGELMRLLNEKSVGVAENAIKNGGIPEVINKYVGPVINWEQCARSEMYPWGGLWGGPVLAGEKDYQKWRAEWDKHPILTSKLREAREIEEREEGTGATLELAKLAFKLVYGEDPDKEIEKKQKEKEAASKAGGKGKRPGEGEEEGEGESGKGKGEGDVREGEGDGEGTPYTGKGIKIITVKWQEVMGKDHGTGNLTGIGQKLDLSTYRASGHTYAGALGNQIKVIDLTSKRRA